MYKNCAMQECKTRLPAKEKAKRLMLAAALSVGIAELFYDCMWVAALFPLLYAVLVRRRAVVYAAEQKAALERQFIDAAKTAASALLAGFSMENAWLEAEKETKKLYGGGSILAAELSEINRAVAMSVPIEEQLLTFAKKTESEDILAFAEVFSFAKRSGGDFVKIIDATVGQMKQKQATMQEIEVLVAAKRLEQKVMNVIPLALLLYLKLFSEGYLDALYKNTFGVLVMTAALALYGAAIYLAEKIMDISV